MAKKDKSAIVSGAGFLASFWLALERAVKERGGTDEDLHRLGTEDGEETIGQMAELVVAAGKPTEQASTYITHLSDNEAAAELDRLGHFDVGSGEAEQLIANWRKLAAALGYTGPVAWKVRAGFTLKQHAPKVGPCFEDFQYLQEWNFEDKPTEDGLVFWIPRLVPDSTNKTADEQLARLAELRKENSLPEVHLTDFGSASLLAGLILAEFKRSGDRVPLNRDYVRTSTRHSDGYRLPLGDFDETGLACRYDWWDVGRDSSLGVFPLGVGH